MDRISDSLVQYKKSYNDFVSALKDLNVMQFNEPYRSHFQALEKDLALHELILNAMVGREQPQPVMFFTLQPYQRPHSIVAEDELGARVPIPESLLEQFNVSHEYTEDRDE